MQRARRHAIALCALLAAAAPALAGPTPGASAFAACAVCHGADAAGIPGAFPPLLPRVAEFAKTPAGRAYLIMVVTAGLIGDLPVDGTVYRGVMPPQAALDAAQVAAVLNHVAAGLGTTKAPARAFDAREVGEVRGRNPGATGQSVRAMRPEVAAQ